MVNELTLDLTVGLSLWIYSLMQRMKSMEKLQQEYSKGIDDSFGPEDVS